jgi:hypothetical protein
MTQCSRGVALVRVRVPKDQGRAVSQILHRLGKPQPLTGRTDQSLGPRSRCWAVPAHAAAWVYDRWKSPLTMYYVLFQNVPKG